MWRKLRPDILRNILTEPVNGGTAGTKPYDENRPSSPVIPVSVVITVQQIVVDQTRYIMAISIIKMVDVIGVAVNMAIPI